MAAFSELVDAAAEYSKTHGAYLLRIDPEIPETDAGMLALTQKKGFLLDQASDFTLFQPRKKSYYRAVLDGLGAAARLYIAELEGTPVAGAMAVVFGETCSFFYSCSAKGSEKTHANELLQWRMQTDALRLGCTRFDFRGVIGYPDDHNPHLGLHSYKHGFGAEFRAYIGQLDLPLRPWMYSASSYLCARRTSSGN